MKAGIARKVLEIAHDGEIIPDADQYDEALEFAIDAVEKQIPKRVKVYKSCRRTLFYVLLAAARL